MSNGEIPDWNLENQNFRWGLIYYVSDLHTFICQTLTEHLFFMRNKYQI